MTDLTEQQQIFVREYVSNGGRGAEAARAAGFSEVSSGRYAYQLLEKPHVAEAIRAEQRRVLGGRVATKAISVLEGILDDAKAPYGARVDAAKAVLDRGGLVAPKAPAAQEPDDRKPLSELSLEELYELIRIENAKAAQSGAGGPREVQKKPSKVPSTDSAAPAAVSDASEVA